MIRIIDKKDCCGCGACAQRCPKQCISLKQDAEGFLYPVVDESKCIDCGLCEKVCPELNVFDASDAMPRTLAAYSLDVGIRAESSSGGLFSALAQKILSDGGAVFGARFDADWSVVHGCAETAEELAAFRGSKYLQSRIGQTYVEVRERLNRGQKVLFSGTPCQVSGLKHFLSREYDGLLTVDFVCHGVPSPMVWREYLKSILRTECAGAGKNTESLSLNAIPLEGITFRDKRLGWKKFGIRLKMSPRRGDKNSESALQTKTGDREIFEPFPDNAYMRVFLSNLSLRPSCYSCRQKGFTSGADITIGDFWGIQNVDPDIDDNKGMSVVFLNTEKGRELFVGLSEIFSKEEPLAEAVRYNSSVVESVAVPTSRRNFFHVLQQTSSFDKACRAAFHVPLWRRAYGRSKRILRGLYNRLKTK